MKQRLFAYVLLCTASLLAQQGELLKNPGFDQDVDGDGLPDHWSASSERVLWRELVYMSHNYAITSKSPTYVLATQDLTLKKGATYTLVMRCRAAEGGLAGALIVHGETKPKQEMSLLWNVRADNEFHEYMRTFKAPNPVARLYLYNVAKSKGTVTYDRVSLREGGPDRVFVTQLSFKEIDTPIEPPLESPHIDWASPLAGGALKAFITIRNFRCQRQVVELQQRLETDADIVHTGYVGEACVSETGLRATKRLRESYYEVYVVPSRVTPLLAKTIRARMEAGAGLVVVEGFGQIRAFMKADALTDAPDGHPLRDVYPDALMPERIYDGVRIGKLGKGRVVRLSFPTSKGRVWGLLPVGGGPEVYIDRQVRYWEWWEALLAQAMRWAARGAPSARIAQAEADGSQVVISVTDAPAGARLRVILRSSREVRHGEPDARLAPQTLALDTVGRASIPIPANFPAGAAVLDAVLLDAKGRSVTWRSFAVERSASVSLSALMVTPVSCAKGQTVKVTAQVQGKACALRLRVVDARGRLLLLRTRPCSVATEEREESFEFSLDAPLCVHHTVELRALVGDVEQDRVLASLYVPEVGRALALDDFTVMPWSPGMSHPMIAAQYSRMTQALGLNAEFAHTAPHISARGVLGAGYIGGMGMFREKKKSTDGVRRRCLHDPEVIAKMESLPRERAAAQRDGGYFAVGITDEAFLSSRHERNELCFSEHTQAAYREWLKGQYGTLDRLNAQWDSAFADWEEIRGVRTEDVRGKDNFSPFVDFRTFMTDTWVSACRRVTTAYHVAAPEIPVGHTNTFGANPFNGNDYWKLATKTGFGWGQEYSEAIKNSGHKAVFDLWRSFVETPEARASRGSDAPFFNYGWIGYAHRPEAAQYEPWWLALHGARGLSYYATNAVAAERGVSWALVHPRMSRTPFSLAVTDALADLRTGCGKLFMEYERERPRIALLWSHASMLVAWCESSATEPVPDEGEGTDSYGRYFRSALDIRQHLNELQFDYVHLAPEQLGQEDLVTRQPLLFLPFTMAVSSRTVEALLAYVRAGGTLVGDLRCLRTDEHGRIDEKSTTLRTLFGVERPDGAPVVYGPSRIRFTGMREGIGEKEGEAPVIGRETLRPAGADALATHTTGEGALFTRRLGKGRTVYLNFALPQYDSATRRLVGQLCTAAGLSREVTVEAVDGDAPPRAYERTTFRRGAIAVHAFIRDFRRCEDSDPVEIRFGGEAHLYDVRGKRYVGRTSTVRTTLSPGRTAVYAALPYRANALVVGAPKSVERGGTARVALAIRAGEGVTLGDHVVHVRFVGPDGADVSHYTRNTILSGGSGELVVPIALNEAEGRWRVLARDVLTGLSGTAEFLVHGTD